MGSILVTGASGNVGRALVRRLARAGSAVRGATRDPSRARRLVPECAEWVRFDFERPETFTTALRGVSRVFLIARPGDDEPARTAASFLDATVAARVEHVVTLSAMGADHRDDVTLGRLERLVEETGLAWTHLRPNWFMQVFATDPLLSAIRSSARIEVPAGDGAISWIDARDVAATAAVTLTSAGHAGRAYLLTGPEAIDHRAVAMTLSDASGRTIRYHPLDEVEGREAVLAAGLGRRRAERLTRFYRLVRAGACATVSDDVESVLGRPPLTLRRFASDHRQLWAVRRPSPSSTPSRAGAVARTGKEIS